MKTRLFLVLVAAALSAASATTSQNTQPPPPAPPGEAQAANGGAQPGGSEVAPGTYQCYSITSGTTLSSLCFGSADRCEHERQAANADGSRTTACQPAAPVSCFQLAGDANPSMELCAANADDCELWRLVDQDKNGKTGDVCQWKHAQRQ